MKPLIIPTAAQLGLLAMTAHADLLAQYTFNKADNRV